MKQTNKFLTLFIVLLSAITFKMGAQCTNTSSYGSPVAPAQGTSITAVSCQYAGEYNTTSSVVAGNTYWVNSTVPTDYFTIRIGASNGTLVASGPAPLVWTATVSGTYYIHCNTNAACGTQSSCRNVLMGCYGPACTNTSAYGTIAAPNPTLTNYISCQYAGEYGTATSVVAGNVYVSASSVSTDYYTIRSGTSSGPVVAAGPSPLTWTAQVAGTHYMHVSSSSLCATQSSCRNNSLTCIGGAVPAAPANDLCSGATTLAVPSTTAGTTVNATAESPAPGTCGTTLSQPGVWYKVVGNGNQLGVSLCASSWDSKIFVYTGSCGAWTCVTGDDDSGPICSGGAASATFCSIPSVSYYVLVTGYSSASAFTIAVSQTVNAGTTPTISPIALTPSICLGSAGTLSVSGASSYAWSNGATGASISITPTASGVYTVYGVAAASCDYDIKTVAITSIATPTVSLSTNNGSICPGGSFTTTASGAVSYTFNGSPSGTVVATTATLSPIVNTTYTVIGTASNGCKSLLANSPTATVTTLASPSLTVVATPSAVCPGVTSSLSVSGANTYTWTSLGSSSSVVSVSASATSIYTVTGTGTTVCNGVKTITLTVYPTPTITAASGTLCSGSVYTTVPSGAATYSFSSGSNTVSLSSSTVINVTGTSSNGCISTAPAAVNVTVVTLPVVSVNSGTACSGDVFHFAPSGADTYTYVGGYSNPLITSTSGTYGVIGTNSTGCVSLPAVSNLTIYSLPVISVVATPSNMTICNTQTLSFTASGAVSYNWNNTAQGSTLATTPSVSGSYFVVGTDTNGCVGATSFPYIVNPLPPVAVSGTTFVCQGGSATITAGGALTYSWSNNASTNSLVVTPTVTTVYTVVGTNTFGCVKSKTFSVVVNTITVHQMPDTALCIGNSINVTAPGGVSYTWTPVASIFSALNITPSVTATYSYHTIDSKSCHHMGMITVSVNALPVVTATGSQSMICSGETATITAAGATSYMWTSPTSTTGAMLVVHPVNTMVYVVTGTDNNGCASTTSVSLAVSKCAGVNQIASEVTGLNIYPNPNNGIFTVELANGFEKNIQIIDIAGRIVGSGKTSEDMIDMHLTELANGIYYVKIQSNNAVSIVKVIKQ